MVVGHLPFMGRLVSHLVAGSEKANVAAFQPGTVACLERAGGDEDGGGWALAWMVRPELLGGVVPSPVRRLYQGALIMTHRDRVGGSSGRRKVAGDAGHRQNFSTPSDGPHTRPQRRLTKAFGRRRARFAMPRIATAHAPGRKPW